MIKFKYNMDDSLFTLINHSVINHVDSYLIGYIKEDIMNQLKYTSLFLVCKYDRISGTDIYSSPVVIVARNDIDACSIYHELSGEYGTVHSILQDDCRKLKVELING